MKTVVVIALTAIVYFMGWLFGMAYQRQLKFTFHIPEPKPIQRQVTKLMNVSAYCPCEKCCGKFADGITASGAPAVGFLVAAPPAIPFGTMLTIEGYAGGKPVEVLDRGGSIKGNRLDLLFDTHQEALNWGRQYLEVTFN